MLRSGTAAVDHKAMATYVPSRPLLECHVRRRLQAIGNVTILSGHDVAGLTSTADRGRVTGVRVVNRDGGAEKELTADLVIDAMGRGAHTPALLERLGYGRPVEDHIVMHTTYASQPLRIAPGTLKEGIVLIGPVPGRPTGMALFGCENDTWLFTVIGMAGREPPGDRAGMIAFAQEFGPPHVLAAVRAAEPLGEVARHRMPSSQLRRYDKMRRFPDGLLVFGDAICSFNPIYGQGMTVAALEASALRDCLRHGDRDLSRRFFRAAAKPIAAAWQLAAGGDLALPEVEGPRPLSVRIANAYTDWVLTACESDAVVAGQFFKVNSLVDAPSRLLRPAFVYRVATVNLRRRRGVHQSRRGTRQTTVPTWR
jgi:2-polyprenyl-6-methoxyphenol hydroxylase-like FAD-dependent oxidoreductase